MSRPDLKVLIGGVDPQFDSELPGYRPRNPASYLVFALCHENLAGPSVRQDASKMGPVVVQDYLAMVPRLAERFSEDPDGSWTVRIRSGVRSDAGNELTAEDVKWTFTRAFAKKHPGAYRWGLSGFDRLDRLEVVDKYTLRFRLDVPNPHLSAFLFSANPPILDSVELRAHSTPGDSWGEKWLSAGNIAGYGPYKLLERGASGMTFAARSAYWRGPQPETTVRVDRVESRATALAALDSDDPIYLAGLMPDEASSLQGRSDVSVNASWAGNVFVGMDYFHPPFDDIRVRHALNYAVPYQRIIDDALLGLARPWRGPLCTYDVWYTSDYWHYETSVEKARELLKEAGFGNGFTAVLYLPLRRDLERIGLLLKEAYAAVGVDLELRDNLEIHQGWTPSLWLATGGGMNFHEPVYNLAHEFVAKNPVRAGQDGRPALNSWQGLRSGPPEFGRLLEDLLQAPTVADRHERALRLQKGIVQFAPMVFLAETMQINVANRHAPAWTRDYQNRLIQVLQFQNCGTNYLPRN